MATPPQVNHAAEHLLSPAAPAAAAGPLTGTGGADPGAAGDGGRGLADVMSVNAVFSAATATVMAVGAPWLGPVLGVDGRLLAGLGIALGAFAAALVWLLATPTRLRAGARLVIAADAAWIVGAAVVIAAVPGGLGVAGDVALAAVSVVVALLGAGQWLALRRAGEEPLAAATPLTVQVSRAVAAPVDVVWDAIADVGGYAAFADGIAATEVVSGAEMGMVRRCTDDRGGQWSEACTLWEERRRYRMTVDTGSYPARYRMLLAELAQTWEIEPAGDATRVTLRFDGAVRLGVIGRLAIAAAGLERRAGAIVEAYDRHLTRAGADG